MMTRARRDVTGRMEQRTGFVRDDIRVGGRVGGVVRQMTEGLGFKVVPGQFPAGIEYETGFGDVVDKLFGVAEVRAPGNIPGEGRRPRAHRHGRPVYRRVPRGCAAGPGFAVETADVGRIFNDLASLIVGQHAHELVAAVGIVGESGRTGCAGRLVGFYLVTADLVTRLRALNEPVAVRVEREPG